MLRKSAFRHRCGWLLLALLFPLVSCKSARWEEASWEGKEVGSFEYHPLIYHLDLCILAYQLYAQTLVWPFDPYYEELNNNYWHRTTYTRKVRGWAEARGVEQWRASAGLEGYRGPGVLGGFNDNPRHDPILFRYDGIDPRRTTISNASGGEWDEFEPPAEIVGRIGDVYMCWRTTGEPPGVVSLERVSAAREDQQAPDVLLAFEGGTGNKGEVGQPPSQSLMGFVLVRTKSGGGYDVHVVFRGSRSGSAGRAVRQAFSDSDAEGNPDWITDLGGALLTPERGGAPVSATGMVSRGFAHAMASTLPQVVRCLEEVAEIRDGTAPDHVYVTGHSLGGALAQHFVSAVLLGADLGPDGTGADMPASLAGWPWKEIKLISYAAPLTGDEAWARTLTESGLDAEFALRYTPFDKQALPPSDPVIVTRLSDASRPAGYRVLISSDPVATERAFEGNHVGKTVYLNRPCWKDYLPRPDFNSHYPQLMREFLVDCMPDSRTPDPPWDGRRMTTLNPERGNDGIDAELEKLARAVERYYADKDVGFDLEAFRRDVELRFAIGRHDE